MKNVLVVLSGPSGVGKGTIAKILTEKRKDLKLSVSCTTRKPRTGELDGREYFFIDKKAFTDKIEKNGFLEYSEHFGNYYGTPIDFVKSSLENNDVLLEIEVNGGLNAKKVFPDAVLIFVMPPSIEELKHRLKSRGTESDQDILNRLSRIDYETEKGKIYDYRVINDDLDKAVSEIENIIDKEKNKN